MLFIHVKLIFAAKIYFQEILILIEICGYLNSEQLVDSDRELLNGVKPRLWLLRAQES